MSVFAFITNIHDLLSEIQNYRFVYCSLFILNHNYAMVVVFFNNIIEVFILINYKSLI